ncbi:cadherin domain-containing protein [Flavobacterium sp.]|uniref:cadherin domain-containing protein n=1 Tax=Flavobacterium sp. TaxID=239 RepID=UPI003C510F47
MKNYIYSTIVLFLISFNTFGQSPTWTVNENNFQFAMTFVGSLNIDGVRLSNVNDKVGAFVNGECRGVANLIYVATEKKYYVYLTVSSNTNNETVSFKIYDSVKDEVKDVVNNINFASNANFGDLSQTYIFSNTALQQGTDLLDVGFVGVTRNDITIVGNKITVYLNPGQSVTSLNTTFTTSPAATVYIGSVQQLSGANTLDFTNPITFKVFAEDQTKSKEWIVSVQLPVYPVTLPTVFTLSKLTIDENQPVGTDVGDFSVLIEDRNVTDISLVAGDGGFDNASFEIIGNSLKVKTIFDFEAKSLYKIRVKAISIRKEVLEKTFEITVLDDKLPTGFTLSKLTIDENQPIGTIVGDFTVVKEDRKTFDLTLVEGVGGNDNASFEISGNSLKVKSIFDFETKSSYNIRVQAVNNRGDVLEQAFTVTVLDDKLPTVFTLLKLTIPENQPVGTSVADFNVVKEDRNAFDLTLVEGVGADDNASFEITGKSLKVKSVFDFETKSIYKIRVQAVSSRGDVLEQSFTITVLDDKLPTIFTLSKLTIDENEPVATVVGDFTVIKENRNVFDLTLVDGVGADDNALFEITGTNLKSKEIFDFETKNVYHIRVKAENTLGEILFATFVITINDINDTPVLITLSNAQIIENSAIGTVIGTLTTKDQDKDSCIYSFFIAGSDYLYFDIVGSQLVLKKNIDFETQKIFQFDLISDDQRGGQVKEKMTIFVLDKNENPVITKKAGSNTIDFTFSELSNSVAVVGKIEATDVDANTTLSYEIISNPKVPFTISNDGTISSDGTIDSENKTTYTFNVKVTDNGSPKLSDTVTVIVTIEFKVDDALMYNNLVSPNGDGHNDRLLINNIQSYSDYNMSIYNSKGQLVFTTDNYQNDWMGNGLPEGEYYLYFAGKDQNKKERIYKQFLRLVYN